MSDFHHDIWSRIRHLCIKKLEVRIQEISRIPKCPETLWRTSVPIPTPKCLPLFEYPFRSIKAVTRKKA